MEVVERDLPVHNFFLIKHILDDKECKDELLLIGTMIQHVYRGKGGEFSTDDNPYSGDNLSLDSRDSRGSPTSVTSVDSLFPTSKRREGEFMKFKYRFNDETAGRRNLDLRRTEIHETQDLGRLYRHTYQVKVPLELQVQFDAFPFKVKSGTLMIELTTFTSEDLKTRLRPNILIHRNERRGDIIIQKDINAKTKKTRSGLYKEQELFRQAKEKMDRSYMYDFVSPFPNVTYYYDSKKKYCPKYSMQFLLVEDGVQKFMEIVCPLFLIAAMNHLNVMNAVKAFQECEGFKALNEPEKCAEVEAVDFLSNSATLALAVVVLLPTMSGMSRFHLVLQGNNLYMATIVVALALSALPHYVVETTLPAQVGAYVFWGSFVFPVVNGIRFWHYIRSHKSPKSHVFMGEARGRTLSEKIFRPSATENVMDDFISVRELVELPNHELASRDLRLREGGGKFKMIELSTAPLMHA